MLVAPDKYHATSDRFIVFKFTDHKKQPEIKFSNTAFLILLSIRTWLWFQEDVENNNIDHLYTWTFL